jgi:membrane protein YdbS with pleckstrin-like domain
MDDVEDAPRAPVRLRPRAARLFWPVALVWAAAWLVPQHWNADGGAGRAALVALVGLAVLLLAVAWLRWWTTVCTVDAWAVTLRRGVLRRSEQAVPLAAITGVTVHRGVLQRFWGSGHVDVRAGATTLRLPRMPAPTLLQTALLAGAARAAGRPLLAGPGAVVTESGERTEERNGR